MAIIKRDKINMAADVGKLQVLALPPMLLSMSFECKISDKKLDGITQAQIGEAATDFVDKQKTEFTAAIKDLDKVVARKIAAANGNAQKVADTEQATANSVCKQICAAT